MRNTAECSQKFDENTPEKLQTCSQCGATYSFKANFCGKCGNKLTRPPVKAVGPVSSEIKDYTENYLEKMHRGEIKNEEIKQIESLEEEKSPAILEAINMANEYLSDLKASFGIKHLNISASNIHLLTSENARKLSINTSGTSVEGQPVIIADPEIFPQIYIAKEIFHEMLHGSSFLSVNLVNKGLKNGTQKINFDDRRSGLKTTNRKGQEFYSFTGLNEAITEQLSTNFYNERLVSSGLFDNELEQHQNILHKSGTKSFSEIDPKYPFITKPINTGVSIKTASLQSNYIHHMDMLDYIAKSVSSALPDKYPSEEAVMEMITRSFFRGNLVDLSKALIKTFGRPGFEMIKKCDNSKQSAIDTLEYLKIKEEAAKL